MRRLYTALSGHTAVMSCGRDPVKPVKWTFQHLPDSAVEDINYSERFRLHNSSLIICRVKTADSGTYSCTDAAGELHAIQLTVIGKLHSSHAVFFTFTPSHCKLISVIINCVRGM